MPSQRATDKELCCCSVWNTMYLAFYLCCLSLQILLCWHISVANIILDLPALSKFLLLWFFRFRGSIKVFFFSSHLLLLLLVLLLLLNYCTKVVILLQPPWFWLLRPAISTLHRASLVVSRTINSVLWLQWNGRTWLSARAEQDICRTCTSCPALCWRLMSHQCSSRATCMLQRYSSRAATVTDSFETFLARHHSHGPWRHTLELKRQDMLLRFKGLSECVCVRACMRCYEDLIAVSMATCWHSTVSGSLLMACRCSESTTARAADNQRPQDGKVKWSRSDRAAGRSERAALGDLQGLAFWNGGNYWFDRW